LCKLPCDHRKQLPFNGEDQGPQEAPQFAEV
jgi:hypothetical protein